MSPKIHILLPVHNRKVTTERFLSFLRAQTYDDWNLVLIDDGSQDGTEAMVRAEVPAVTVLRGNGHWWWGGALQQGYLWLRRRRPAESDLVLIINDDTDFEPDFLASAVKAMAPRSLLLAQCYDLDTGRLLEAGIIWDWAGLNYRVVKDGAEPINCFSTRGLFLRVADFLEIGGFHPVLLPHYLSDYEFTQRAHRKGFALITAPEVFLRSDVKLTGVHSVRGYSLLRAFRTAFSIRSAANPIYWTSYVLLACPWRFLPANLLRVWRRFVIVMREDLRAGRGQANESQGHG